LGVEAPLWTELLSTRKDIEYMAFQELVAYWQRWHGLHQLKDLESFQYQGLPLQVNVGK